MGSLKDIRRGVPLLLKLMRKFHVGSCYAVFGAQARGDPLLFELMKKAPVGRCSAVSGHIGAQGNEILPLMVAELKFCRKLLMLTDRCLHHS